MDRVANGEGIEGEKLIRYYDTLVVEMNGKKQFLLRKIGLGLYGERDKRLLMQTHKMNKGGKTVKEVCIRN